MSFLSPKLSMFGKRGYMNIELTAWLQEVFGLFFGMFCIKLNAEKIGVPLDGYCKAKTCQIF